MPDREKVIKGLMVCTSKPCYCANCPYKANCCLDSQEVMEDALALLKEQEPVKPVNVRWEMGINGGNCPKCMNWVQRSFNFCPFCGKAVKWK